MVVSARAVAAALGERLPGLGKVKQHKLLYHCQGHHLATFGEPLFKDGVHGESPSPGAEPGEAELNTIGYVVSRYGELTGKDPENEEDVPLDLEAVAAWLADAQEPPAEPDRPDERERLLAMRAEILARRHVRDEAHTRRLVRWQGLG